MNNVGELTVFARPILYRGQGSCPHSARLLEGFRFSNGSLHFVSRCLLCGGRSDAIARRDLEEADVDWRLIPVREDRAESMSASAA